MNSGDPSPLLKEFRRAIDGFLSGAVAKLIREAAVPSMAESTLYSLLGEGKRIRPALCLLCAGADPAANSAPDSARLYAACALETLHCYSLIHDDLPAMDNDDLRRGRPSNHKQFNEWTAILAGDALNTLSFELIARGAALDPTLDAAELVLVLARAGGIGGMVCGQALDLEFEKNPDAQTSAEDARRGMLRDIHTRKTAALIRAACEMGALSSGHKSEAARLPFRRYGESLGLLFQIADDLLDRTADSTALGKTAGKDERSGKLTYPALYGMRESRRMAEELRDTARRLASELKPGPNAAQDHRETLASLPDYVLNREN